MKVIMFAGGTGKRFWPVSRKNNPKQFQPIIENKPLILLKYEYLRLGFDAKDIFLSTGIEYEKEVKSILKELPEQNFIFEPQMRDTGPAVLYAVMHVNKLYPHEIVSTQWVDHYIKDPNLFIKALKDAEKLVIENNKSIIVGVPARFPSPHRGYIKFGKKIKAIDGESKITLCEFIRFVEKPTLEVAKEYLRSGDYVWNPGYFVTKAEYIFEKYSKFAQTTFNLIKEIADNNFKKEIQSKYNKVEKISFDYIFAENLSHDEALVLNTDMGWNDVGEWIALKETLEKSKDDNVSIGNNIDLGSEDTMIYNSEKHKMIATIGLKGMIVVNTPDVVAVFHKDDNVRLKEFLKKLEEGNIKEYL